MQNAIEVPEEDSAQLSPRIYIIGEKNPRAYVYMNGTKYIFDNSLDGFDVNFKIFLTLNLKYPCETNYIYNFIQKGIYGLSTIYDQPIVSVNTLISDLNQVKII